MSIAQSKVTAQGQISVPADVRKKLGIGPGSVLEWDIDEAGRIVIRRAGLFSSEDIHRKVFAHTPAPKAIEELKEGLGGYARKRYARS